MKSTGNNFISACVPRKLGITQIVAVFRNNRLPISACVPRKFGITQIVAVFRNNHLPETFNFIKKSPAQLFSCQFFKIFSNRISLEQLQWLLVNIVHHNHHFQFFKTWIMKNWMINESYFSKTFYNSVYGSKENSNSSILKLRVLLKYFHVISISLLYKKYSTKCQLNMTFQWRLHIKFDV